MDQQGHTGTGALLGREGSRFPEDLVAGEGGGRVAWPGVDLVEGDNKRAVVGEEASEDLEAAGGENAAAVPVEEPIPRGQGSGTGWGHGSSEREGRGMLPAAEDERGRRNGA